MECWAAGVSGPESYGDEALTTHILDGKGLIRNKLVSEYGGGLPVRLSSHELGDSMCKGGVWGHVEDWERIFPFVHTARRENDGDKVKTGILQ